MTTTARAESAPDAANVVAEVTRPQLARRARGGGGLPSAGGKAPMGLVARLLEAPLLWKLVGANALVLVAALLAVAVAHGSHTPAAAAILWSALGLSFALNMLLVWLALRPLAALEETARRVWHGDFAARVPAMATADRDMIRIGRTLNLLLDGLTEDRARMRLLAAQVISAQDAERARISRELHDSTAQTLAAAKLQLQVALQETTDPMMLNARLETLRGLVAEALEETRSLSHILYPRVLDDLGLVAAVEWLARQTRDSSSVDVVVETDVGDAEIPLVMSSVLYRVAQEGLRNAMMHAQATTVTLRVEADDEWATIEVADDGRGFDVAEAEARRPGMGLFAIRERVALVNGSVDFYSVPGRGTRVSATVPLRGGTDRDHQNQVIP